MLKLLERLALTALILVFAGHGFADEGMWMPHQMKELGLQDMGLQMNPDDLYKKDGTGIMSAVVYLRGGTASFVSEEGLILTNHHVAYRAIQRASDKEHDYLTNGFLAKTRAEEIQASGYAADVLLGYEDVTDIFLKALKPGMSPEKRHKTIERIEKKLIAREEKKGKDLRCYVKSMYSGNKYYLFRFKQLMDIRLVYAPPQSIGNFGGEIDNWMWPRHTGDFTFLRAYVSPDNVGVEYSPDNVPYRPKAILNISRQGVKPGDFTFVMGYPGFTSRNYTSLELQEAMSDMKQRIALYLDTVHFFEKAGEKDRGIEIKYASIVKGLNNGLKNRQGKLEGLEKQNLLEKKHAFEEKWLHWVTQQPERQKKYGSVLTDIENFIRQNAGFYEKERRLSFLTNRVLRPALFYQAYRVYRVCEERQKPDIKREPGYQERDMAMIKTGIKMAEKGYDLETDKAYFKYRLKQFLTQPAAQHPRALAPILAKGPAAVDSYVDNLYEATLLKTPEKCLELLELKPAELLKLGDPLIQLAAGLEKEMKVVREQEKIIDQQRKDIKKIYMASLLEMNGGKIASDANSSIRFTCGTIVGYQPKDAVSYLPFTTLKGIIEKDSGAFPFDVPEKLKALYEAKDFGRYRDENLGGIPVCFLNTTCVTGGSSGSPTLNARGELAGLIFDMTYESVIGDYYIIPELQRTISVDIRYVLFITEKFSGAHHLITEMKLR